MCIHSGGRAAGPSSKMRCHVRRGDAQSGNDLGRLGRGGGGGGGGSRASCCVLHVCSCADAARCHVMSKLKLFKIKIKGVFPPRTRFLSGISWTALTLEVGKSPTEVPQRQPVAPPSAICELASSSSPSWSLNRAVLDDGRQHGVQDQGARARPALAACATRPGHPVNMLTVC